MDLKLMLKNKIIKKLWILSVIQLLCVLSIPISSYAQSSKQPIIIEGVVKDSSGALLLGTTVLEKGTTNGTQTDFDGKFSLQVSDKNVIILVSYIGYTAQEISLNNRNFLTIVLKEDSSSLDEIVVVGYGSQSKTKVTNAISSMKSASIERLPSGGFESALAGQMSGIQVVQGSGNPGSDAKIIIRGTGTISAGSNPLIVVDGFPLTEGSSLSSINSNDIATIDVLKDAASAAIYGSRGSNGVILITTKKGKNGETKVNVNLYSGFQSVVQSVEMMDAYEFSKFVKEGRDNYYVGLNPGTNLASDSNTIRIQRYPGDKKALIPDNIIPYLNDTPGLTNTNWLDEIFKIAPISSIDLSISGGSDKTKYFVSGNYFNQEGIIIGSDYKRFTVRLNLETKITNKLKYGINLTPSSSDRNVVPEGWGDSPITQALNSHPIYSVYNADGSFNLSEQNNKALVYDMAQTENPVAVAAAITNNTSRFRIFGNTFLEYGIIEGLKYKSQFGYDFTNSKTKYYRPSYIGAYRDPAPSVARGTETTNITKNWLLENTLNYNKSFGEHNLDLLAGYTFQKENGNWNKITGTGFANDLVNSVSAASNTSAEIRGYEWSLISFLGRAKYDYQGKYLLSAAIRRDGSSRFGANTKWGMFPSISAGWRVSEEEFFSKEGTVSELKLRASWGQTGNNQIPNYGSQALLSPANAILGENLTSGLAPSTSPNSNLSWETTSTTDIGVEAGFFDNKLSLTADYYLADTKDMLLNVPVPTHSGFGLSLQNIGKIRNQGLEFVLNVNNLNLGEVEWSSSFNISINKNKVLALAPEQEQIVTDGTNITKVGGELGAHYGYIIEGIYKTQQEIDNSPHFASAKIGSYIYKDTDGDGDVDADDRTTLGSFHPDYTFGISNTLGYKNFDLNVLISGVQGVEIRDNSISVLLYNQEGWGNASRELYLSHFNSTTNPNGTYGIATPRPTDNNFRRSNLFNDDGSYVRVRNITLGYSLPESVLEKLPVSKLRLYVSSKNPFTWTNARGFNPEITSSNALQPGFSTFGSYPAEKSFVLGLNVSF